ncbi:hypothetical protein [Helicobacter sp. MIT 99-5507]|uniref:hypothetical protein n=1 Tax=Helicobacter sp. MIT 99-5507 TaxID=152489 RepID=UPI000E1E392E|nr:hypothetical protein [Helicobacter sp. MIT 99-5507]RDU56678.1 hypothetical protein CQA42_07650 [Helicobacter sp. MIT 99-5507]
MRYLLLFFILVGIINAEFIGEITLKKDEVKNIELFVENSKKILTFRWTLYKDGVLITHFKYDGIPYQFSLYKEHSNSAKITLSSINSANNANPYMIFYFTNYDDMQKEARFRYYIFNFNSNVEVM